MLSKGIVCAMLVGISVLLGVVLLAEVTAQEFPKVQIAFVSDRDGGKEIYVMDVNGENLQKLTDTEKRFWNYDPAWSPDGKMIAFVSDRDIGVGVCCPEIYVMDADGENLRRLTNAIADHAHPSWSPDGRKIAFESDKDGNYDIYVVDVDGRSLRKLTKSSAADRNPSWSPDGRKIAFESNLQIYIMDAVGGNRRKLTERRWGWNVDPAWSPDGKKIAFTSTRDGDSEIYVMDADGRNQRNLTNNPAADYDPSWSPDGNKIVFVSERDGNREIYVMDADGSNQRRLTNDPAKDFSPDWCKSPYFTVIPTNKLRTLWGWLKTFR